MNPNDRRSGKPRVVQRHRLARVGRVQPADTVLGAGREYAFGFIGGLHSSYVSIGCYMGARA